MPSNKDIQAKRAQAQTLQVTVHVGKSGITEATLDELNAQLKSKKLVKVRLLRSATHETSDKEEAQKLADATGATLVDVRGHTAVYWKK